MCAIPHTCSARRPVPLDRPNGEISRNPRPPHSAPGDPPLRMLFTTPTLATRGILRISNVLFSMGFSVIRTLVHLAPRAWNSEWRGREYLLWPTGPALVRAIRSIGSPELRRAWKYAAYSRMLFTESP